MITSLQYFLVDTLRATAAVVAAILPARYWSRFDTLPISRMAIPSAIVTFVIGAFVEVWNYLVYAAKTSASLTNAFFKVAEQQALVGAAGVARPGDVETLGLQAAGIPTVFGAALCTPWGLFATYLTLSAIVRGAARYVGDPFGDPLLSGVDAFGRHSYAKFTRARQQRTREHQEGPEVPDRLVTGLWVGMRGVDYVVIASRRKHGWSAGALVMTPGASYRMGEPFDMHLPEGLRTAYPLTELQTTEVARRGILYELPPLDASPPVWR